MKSLLYLAFSLISLSKVCVGDGANGYNAFFDVWLSNLNLRWNSVTDGSCFWNLVKSDGIEIPNSEIFPFPVSYNYTGLELGNLCQFIRNGDLKMEALGNSSILFSAPILLENASVLFHDFSINSLSSSIFHMELGKVRLNATASLKFRLLLHYPSVDRPCTTVYQWKLILDDLKISSEYLRSEQLSNWVDTHRPSASAYVERLLENFYNEKDPNLCVTLANAWQW